MNLVLKRIFLGERYTIGKLYIDGEYFCDILEDPVRDLNKNGKFDNGEKKVWGDTAIPYGTYKITMNVVSPKFGGRSWARPYGGKVPRLLNVPHFNGILIHPGNTAKDTHGCLLPGENKEKGKVINSINTYHRLMKKLLSVAGEIWITII